MNPICIDQWLSIEQQRKYVFQLKGQIGLTRCRAEYFVKLWVYLLIKEQKELGKNLKPPLTQLDLPAGFVACSYREAQQLFYSEQDQGSDRAAGMMIDKFAALGLIEKDFDGNTTCIRIRSVLPTFDEGISVNDTVQVVADEFNPRTDAIPVASFLARHYDIVVNKKALPQRIARILREWAQIYPTGIRVLRRCDTHNPVGCCILFPVAKASEDIYFCPPSKTLYLSLSSGSDPIKMAPRFDPNCITVQVRAWIIDPPFNNRINISQFLKDAEKTLIRMQSDFPNLCDMYLLASHPSDEHLGSALGYQKIMPDAQSSLCWMYTSIDKYLALDIDQVVSNLNLV